MSGTSRDLPNLDSTIRSRSEARADIVAVEPDGLPDPKPCARQQSDERAVGIGAQRAPQTRRRGHQRCDLLVGVEVGDRPSRSAERQHIVRRYSVLASMLCSQAANRRTALSRWLWYRRWRRKGGWPT